MDIIRRQVAKFGLDQLKNFMVDTLLPQFPRYRKMQDNLLMSFQRNQYAQFKRLRGGNDSDDQKGKKAESSQESQVKKQSKKKCVSDENFEIPCSLSSFEKLFKCSRDSCELLVNDKIVYNMSKDNSDPTGSGTTKKSTKKSILQVKQSVTRPINYADTQYVENISNEKISNEKTSNEKISNEKISNANNVSSEEIQTSSFKKLEIDKEDKKQTKESSSSESLKSNDSSYPIIKSLLKIILKLSENNEKLTKMLTKNNSESIENFSVNTINNRKSSEQQNFLVTKIHKSTQYESLPDIDVAPPSGSRKQSNTEFVNNSSLIFEESAVTTNNQKDSECLATNGITIKSTRKYPTEAESVVANIKANSKTEETQPTFRHTPTNHSNSYRSLDDHFTQANEFNRFSPGTNFQTNSPHYFFATDGSFNHASNINENRNYNDFPGNAPVNRNRPMAVNSGTQEDIYLPQRFDYINFNMPHLTNNYETFPMLSLEWLYSNSFNQYNNNVNNNEWDFGGLEKN